MPANQEAELLKRLNRAEAERRALKGLCAFLFIEVAQRSKTPAKELKSMIADLKRLTKNPSGPEANAFTQTINQVIRIAETTLPTP